MFFQLYFLLVAALVPAVGADYLLYRAFAEAGCAGAGEPLGVFFPGCTPSGKPDSGVKVACTSSTTYTLYGYSNDQCSGAPVANTPTNTSACAYKDFWTDSVCVTGDFDPVTPQAYFSIDRYQVFSPSGTSSACPPFGVGSHFSQRSYYPAAILGQKAVPGQCIPAPPNTEDVSLLFTCSSDGSYKYEMFGGRQCSGTAGVVSPAGCIARLNNETTFNNGGSLCPPSSPAASTSIGPAGLVGIGAGVGLGVAALALAAFFAYKRVSRRAVDAAPLLGGRKAIGMVDI